VPDHPSSYALSSLKYLSVICGSLGGAIGLAISWSLACTHRLWTRVLSSLCFSFLTISLLLHGLRALRIHGVPDLPTSIHITFATCFLGIPAVFFLTFAHSLLAEGRNLKRLWTISLPLYGLLGGLSSWSFWYFYSEPRSHFVVGWIDGALYGLLHCLGLIAIKLLHLERAFDGPVPNAARAMEGEGESVAPTGETTARSKSILRSAIVLTVFLSFLMFGIGLSSLIAAQSKVLPFQPSDRQALLTVDDLTSVVKNWAPERSVEKSSKVLRPKGTVELTYEYRDPAGRVAVFSVAHTTPSRDDAQTMYWILRDGMDIVHTRLQRHTQLQLMSADPLKWGDEDTLFVLVEGPEIHGGFFIGYKGHQAVLLYVGIEETLESSEAVRALIGSVLRRIERYVP
jgi:hypothetical protein